RDRVLRHRRGDREQRRRFPVQHGLERVRGAPWRARDHGGALLAPARARDRRTEAARQVQGGGRWQIRLRLRRGRDENRLVALHRPRSDRVLGNAPLPRGSFVPHAGPDLPHEEPETRRLPETPETTRGYLTPGTIRQENAAPPRMSTRAN